MPEFDPDAARAREDLTRLLSACFYEPTPMFAEERMFDTLHAAALRLDPALAGRVQRLGAAFAASAMQDLLVDYTRLFLGPVHPRARPYGSCWLDGDDALMQASTLDVIERYREAGFEMDEAFRDLPDHVAVELEFLYVLGFRRHQALAAGDTGAAVFIAGLERRFLGEHLGTWIEPFTAAMRDGAETGFYRELAGLARDWVGRLGVAN